MRFLKKLCTLFLTLALVFSLLTSCEIIKFKTPEAFVEITAGANLTLVVGETYQLKATAKNTNQQAIEWSADGDCISLSTSGLVTALSEGVVTVTAAAGEISDSIIITVKNSDGDGEDVGDGTTPEGDGDEKVDELPPIEEDPEGPTQDPYVGVTKTEFYANYTPATSYMDAYYRSQHGFLSGDLTLPGQYAVEADYRPTSGGKYIRNTDAYYMDDGNTYVVLDAYGDVAMKIYKGGAYITLEEVAAYMYAFGGSSGSLPANYNSKKSTKPSSSIWGEYLRVNHSYFSGDTSRYPYEPVLPNISGCGGSLQYYELDIGTSGTTTPGYNPQIYNNGTSISRGAARIVYTRQDLNGNGVYEQNEVYVFYTHNHYNDFREYLNYYGGWGEMFGNMTGGGEYSSSTNYNPTAYPTTAYKGLRSSRTTLLEMPFYDDKKYVTVFFIPFNKSYIA